MYVRLDCLYISTLDNVVTLQIKEYKGVFKMPPASTPNLLKNVELQIFAGVLKHTAVLNI